MHVHQLFDLQSKVALVTGGAGQYGLPISEALAEAGAHVVIASRNQPQCQSAADQLVNRGLKASADTYDQASEPSIHSLRDRLTEKHECIDVLVNNSVVRPVAAYDGSWEAWRESMEVNAIGLFVISRAFLESMMKRGSGVIINICSIQGVVAPDFENYAGTSLTTPPDYHFHKHGLVGLTKYLAAWAGPRGVRVNAISPGGFRSSGHAEPFISQYCRRVFLKRLAEHDDIKGAVVFLASEASRYITGQNICVDGGYTC